MYSLILEICYCTPILQFLKMDIIIKKTSLAPNITCMRLPSAMSLLNTQNNNGPF